MTQLHGVISDGIKNEIHLAIFDENKTILGSLALSEKFSIAKMGGEWLLTIFHDNKTESNLFLTTLQIDNAPANVKKVTE